MGDENWHVYKTSVVDFIPQGAMAFFLFQNFEELQRAVLVTLIASTLDDGDEGSLRNVAY